MKSLGNLIIKNPQLKLYIKATVWPCFKHFKESYFSYIQRLSVFNLISLFSALNYFLAKNRLLLAPEKLYNEK